MTALALARRLTAALAVVASLVLTACGGGGDGGGGITQPPTLPVVTLTTITIQGNTTDLVEGSQYDFTAVCLYSDLSQRDCTFSVSWTASGPVTTVAPGKVRAMGAGSGELTVSMDGKNGTVKVTVKPDGTPWDSLPVKLTEHEKGVVRDSVLMNGMFLRSMADTVRVWISPSLPDGRASIDSANVRWREIGKGRKVPFFLSHPDSATADVPVYFFPPMDSDIRRCAQAGPSRLNASNDAVTAGYVQVSTRVGCTNWFYNTLAHELGHAVLGFNRRHIPGCNLMGSPCATWREWETETIGVRNETFDKIGELMFAVPSGTKPK